MTQVISAADITCPECNAVGACTSAVRMHAARFERAKILTRAFNLSTRLGFEDVPEESELEMIAVLGHVEDQPVALELLKIVKAIGNLEDYVADVQAS